MTLKRDESIKMKDSVKSKSAMKKPQCPICFEDMTSETKIAQCIFGHLLCWDCMGKLKGKNCSFCDQPVNGRAFGMETYLRSVFGQ